MEIVLKGLTKEFDNKKTNSKVVAVNNVTIDIASGTLVGLLGPSGCGKSTTLFMLSGLLSPTRGQIIFGDKDVTSLEPQKRGIGLVFQNYALYPHMTVLQNILFPLENIGMPKEDRMKRAEEVAKIVQIENLLDRKPSELSGGQQQRVAIARALAKQPDVLLLDEPLSNLDARLRLQTREEIIRIQQPTAVTTVFVTHDREEAMSISDILVVMKLGVVQQVGKPQEIYDDPHNLFVAQFLGTPPINTFTGEIKNGGVYIGEEKIMNTKLPDQKVYIAIRPEGFIPDQKNGVLTLKLENYEVMGRERSIISTHPNCLKPTIRSTVDEFDPTGLENVKFKLKPAKVFLFNYDTQIRIAEDKEYDAPEFMDAVEQVQLEPNEKKNVFTKFADKSKELVNKVVSVFKKKEAKEDEQVVEEKVIAETDQSSQEGEGE